MAKFTGDGTIITIQQASVTAKTDTVTAATNAKPSVMTLTMTNPVEVGDIVFVAGTGLDSLDGKLFPVSNVATNDITLDGSDASAEGAAATAGTVTIYKKGAGNELAEACFATLSIDTQAPSTIDVSTMCASGSLLGVATPPTISFDGFVDPTREGFKELVRASLESPRQSRVIQIEFPSNNGKIIGLFQVGSISYSAGTGAAVAFSGTGTFVGQPTIVGWV